jgi:hypothetical protein
MKYFEPHARIKNCQYIGPDSNEPTSCQCTEFFKESSYCENHYFIIYLRGSELRKRHKDIKRANSAWDWMAELEMISRELEEDNYVYNTPLDVSDY